ncbi:hypothetical protein [uncultured Ruminococcus sp.]|uniref:hypothetical protein n=1 Tax=uncultured Ruminococcus sp. TaxID=165186 RepID=UPI0025D9A24E|nr:hypothetical protein [uncultured Ruminococcus sp.]
MNKFNRFASAAAAFALAAASASCSAPEAITFGKGTQTALTVDGYEVPAGVFIYNEITAYRNAMYDMYYKNGKMPTLDDVKNSTIKDLDSTDWIQDNATDACKDFVASEKEFEKIGESLKETDLAEIKDMLSTYSSESLFSENGVGEESLRKIIENNYKREAIFKHYFGLDAEKGCSEEELKTYYQDKTTRVKYFAISMTDSEGEQYGADEKRRLNNMIDDYVKEINEEKTNDAKLKKIDECEEDYNKYVEKRTAEEEAKAAEEAGETTTTTTTTTTSSGTTTTTTTDPYANEITITKYTTTTADENESSDTTTTSTSAESAASEDAYKKYNDHVFSMPYNKAEKYQYDDNTVYVIIRADIKERMTSDDLWTEDKIESLLSERYYNDFEDMMKNIVKGYSVEKNSKAYRKFTPFDLNLGDA